MDGIFLVSVFIVVGLINNANIDIGVSNSLLLPHSLLHTPIHKSQNFKGLSMIMPNTQSSF